IGGEAARARALLAGQGGAAPPQIGGVLRNERPGRTKSKGDPRGPPPPPAQFPPAPPRHNRRQRARPPPRLAHPTPAPTPRAHPPAGKQQYLAAAKKYDDHGYTDKQYEELYDFYIASPKNPLSLDPNGGMYPDVLQENMRIMVAAGSLKGVLALERIWEPRFVLQYLADNGWFDIATGKGAYYPTHLFKYSTPPPHRVC